MITFAILMRCGSYGEQSDNYIVSFTDRSEAEDFIRKEAGDDVIIHRVDRDYDRFHFYIPGYTEERFDSDIYGILTEEV